MGGFSNNTDVSYGKAESVDTNISSGGSFTSLTTTSYTEMSDKQSNNLEEEIDLSSLATKASRDKRKYYGHKDYETLEKLELKKKDNLEDISHFSNLQDLSLVNCDLDNSSDLENIPNSLVRIDFEKCEIADYSYLDNLSNLKGINISFSDNEINLSDFENRNLTALEIYGVNGSLSGDLSKLSNLKRLEISYTDLHDLSILKNNHNLTSVTLQSNLLSDVSDLYDTNIDYLDLRYNSIQELDLSRFSNLKCINIEGNYNLYTQEFLDYCNSHDIRVDIDQEDINEMNQVREIIDSLDLNGRTDIEKESILYSYVISHMKYSTKKSRESNAEPIKTALEGAGVCAAYSAFFKALCNCAGINAYESSGYAKIGLTGGSHAWNIIEIDDQYYLCDPTWSDGVRENVLDVRHAVYKVKSLWNKLFGDSDLEVDDQYYNVSGDKAKKFMKQHREGTRTNIERNDLIYHDEHALNIIEVDSEQAEAENLVIDTAIASAIPESSGIKKVTSELVDRLLRIFNEE